MRTHLKTCALLTATFLSGHARGAAAPPTPPTYRVDVLSELAPPSWDMVYPNALSASGLAVGYATAPGQVVRGWTWDGSALRMLMPPKGLGGATYASDVNASGTVLGWIDVDGVGTPATWDAGDLLGTLPRLDPAERASAYGLNDLGDVVGASVSTGLLWHDGAVSPVAPVAGTWRAHPMHINNAGLMAGLAVTDGSARPARWVDGVGELLPVPAAPAGESWFAFSVNDMNERGDIIGSSFVIGAAAQGYVWRDGEVVDIADFEPGLITLPSGINDAGWVVGMQHDMTEGRTAFLWIDGVMHDLSALLAPEFAGLELLTANSINNSGVIVATAWIDGGRFPVLLTPVPSPGGAAALVVALGAVLARRRR